MSSPTQELIDEIERFLHRSRSIGEQGFLSMDLLPYLSQLRDMSLEFEANIQSSPSALYSALATNLDSRPFMQEQQRRNTRARLTPLPPQSADINSASYTMADLRDGEVELGFGNYESSVASPTLGARGLKPQSETSNMPVLQILESSMKLIPTLTAAMQGLDFTGSNWLEQDHRLAHVHPITRMQASGGRSQATAIERILAVLGSSSLALEYQIFERNSGWQPKHDQLLSSILQGRDPQCARIPDHFRNFTASLGIVEREKLATSLKFGSKVNLIQALTKATSFSPGLALLLGFECRRLLRLPYRQLSALHSLMCEDSRFLECRSFCEQASAWFIKHQQAYNSTFSPHLARSEIQQHTTLASSDMLSYNIESTAMGEIGIGLGYVPVNGCQSWPIHTR